MQPSGTAFWPTSVNGSNDANKNKTDKLSARVRSGEEESDGEGRGGKPRKPARVAEKWPDLVALRYLTDGNWAKLFLELHLNLKKPREVAHLL